ncbi:Aste57867_10802 [Aphanomyces stellatus]|uniref:Lysosomal dipeptide transporter MFSD1 n=1 Tax=Aphanomyces stellatus TaxID=120398 RepID=A0A485KSY4_9STRA|nr:hypothetical protein As57867_010762 [Aphanomyces stellatus]VFT87671.1 Aste57867_10802 [Aphanomyces stellatus]
MQLLPSHENHFKPIVLVLVSLLNFGGCYCYDNPSALKSQLQQHFSTLAKADYEMYFNLLYSVYSVPNIVLPLFGGVLTDKLGPRWVLFGVTSLMLLGQFIFALGNSLESFSVMLVRFAGRVVFGFGGETVSVAQASLLALWFPSSELAFANGILISIQRLATASNNELSPFLAEHWSVTSATWFGVLVCAISFVAMLGLVPIDAKAEQQIQDDVLTDQENQNERVFKQHIRLADAATFSWTFWLIGALYFLIYAIVGPFNNVASSIFLERDYFRTPPPLCQRCGLGAYANDIFCTTQSSVCPPLTNSPFAHPLPLLSATCAAIIDPVDQFSCSTLPPYLDDAAINCDAIAWKEGPYTHAYCQSKYAAEQAAAAPLSFVPMLMAVTAPVFGYWVDHVGRRTLIAVVAMMAIALAHALLGFTSVSLFLPLAMQGLATCLFLSASWPAVAYCVEPHHVGTAYGILSASVNLGLAIVPMFVVVEYNAMHMYIPYVHVVFMGLAILGIAVAIVLVFLDLRNGGVLYAANMQYAPSQVMPEVEKGYLLPKPMKAYGTSAVS